MQTRHRELNIYTITCIIRRWLNVWTAHEKPLDPVPLALPWELPSLQGRIMIDCGPFQTNKPSTKTTRKESSGPHPYDYSNREPFKTWICCFFPESQGRLVSSLITTQRNAFVRWMISILSPPTCNLIIHPAKTKCCYTGQTNITNTSSPSIWHKSDISVWWITLGGTVRMFAHKA